jgi:UDP-glucose 4-epimerase
MTQPAAKGTLLITGAAGYIGSHFCVEALQEGYEVVALDNLCNSSRRSLQAVEQITQKTLTFVEGDIRDKECLAQLFAEHDILAVVHFAGLKAVGESNDKPLHYYDNNLGGTVALLEAMKDAGCERLVFSSSATVYGLSEQMPLQEDHPTGAINPYGRTKLMIEEVLQDLHAGDPSWRISILRYFNPVGAHSSGEIGESPNDIPNNLMPYIAQVAVGRRPELQVYGNDYPTPDGTGVRDYIHVVDLVRGHLRAIERLDRQPGLSIHNLGTGQGYSVLEAVAAFEKASGQTIAYQFAPRRAGDAAVSYGDPAKAKAELGWEAEYGLARMCEDVWRWQSRHPNGYDEAS